MQDSVRRPQLLTSTREAISADLRLRVLGLWLIPSNWEVLDACVDDRRMAVPSFRDDGAVKDT